MDTALVQLNQPEHLFFLLTVSGFGNPGNIIADFAHSLDLPVGSDIFTLPEGFTVNDDSGLIRNNRLQAATAVPEPSSGAMFFAAFAGLLGLGRLRKSGSRSVVGGNVA